MQFCKKIYFLAKNGEKGVKNVRFWAFLSNLALDFFDFCYETSLIYYFEYVIGSFARKKILSSETNQIGVKNAILIHILLYKTYLVKFWIINSLIPGGHHKLTCVWKWILGSDANIFSSCKNKSVKQCWNWVSIEFQCSETKIETYRLFWK